MQKLDSKTEEMAPTALTWAKHFAFFSQTCLIQIRSVGISPNWDWFWIFFHSISTSFHSLTQSLHCYCSCAFILVWCFSSKHCAIYFVQPRIVRGCCQTPLTMPTCTPWCCLRPCSWTLLESDGCCLRWGATGCTESICTNLSQKLSCSSLDQGRCGDAGCCFSGGVRGFTTFYAPQAPMCVVYAYIWLCAK